MGATIDFFDRILFREKKRPKGFSDQPQTASAMVCLSSPLQASWPFRSCTSSIQSV
jgi:hypothetical protein